MSKVLLSQNWVVDVTQEQISKAKFMAELNLFLNEGIIMAGTVTAPTMEHPQTSILKVMLLIVDSFNATKIEQQEKRQFLFLPTHAKNAATEIFSKYQRQVITVHELVSESKDTGRRLFFQATIGGQNAN